MNADSIIQELSTQIYEAPLSHVRNEANFPNLDNPLHLTILLLDCDTEIDMNGILGFLENQTGRHLGRTAEALKIIGAAKSSALLDSIASCMKKHAITWEGLREDFAGIVNNEITSFCSLHGDSSSVFTKEIRGLTANFSLFNTHYSLEDSYGFLCKYLDTRLDDLQREINKRI